jgi:hypothetical protein
VDGFANNSQGNNMESSSESMNFNASLIQWGQVTGNKTIRDLGIYLYTNEQTGIEEYYMDTHHRNFPVTQQYSLVSRVWSNNNDNGTFFTSDIAASYGIELYPIQGGSLYLGQDTVYVKRLWDEIVANTGISSNQANSNLWHDMMWQYLAFKDPSKAIDMYNSYPNRELKFGISDAQTYHWLHAMNALGRVDGTITANCPIAAAFRQNDRINYVAQNYSASPITVTFSNGYQLLVPAGKLATSFDGNITSSFSQAYLDEKANLNVTVRIYPSFTSGKCVVTSDTEIGQLVVRNIMGQTIEKNSVNNNQANLDLTSCAAGNYFVSVKLTNGKTGTQKIIKF